MGLQFSRTQSNITMASPKSPKYNNDLLNVLPYLCINVDRNLTVHPEIELDVRTSTLDSSFLEGKNLGLFTKKPITKGTIIMKVVREESKMNDAAVNLDPILRATTSTAMYDAWTNLKNTYYDLEKIKRVVNVRMVFDANSDYYYEALQDIPADGELVRIYGFTTWTLELLDILTNKNIVGFMKFIDELSQDIAGDPYEAKIHRLNKVLQQFKAYDRLMILSPKEYDEAFDDGKARYLGPTIKALYIAEE